MPESQRFTRPSIYVEELSQGVRSIEPVPMAVTAFVGRADCGEADTPVPLTSFGEYEQVFGGLNPGISLSVAVRDFFANGGRQALVVRCGPDQGVEASLMSGLKALTKAEFNLLCLLPVDNGEVPQTVWRAAAELCQKRRAFLIIDAPQSWDSARTAEHGVAAFVGESNAALYFPRLSYANSWPETRGMDFAPCGAVAGVFARIDELRGVWKAPAGVEAVLRGVDGLSVKLSMADMQALNPLGVNSLRRIDTAGHVIWGGRTLSTSPEWKYVAIRRLFLFLEASIDRGTQWAVFEPNDEPLWASLRDSVSAFMHEQFMRGVFQGSKPDEAYFVRCDTSTISAADLANGVVNILVGFSPLKPAEFIIFRIQQKTAGSP